MKLSNEQNRIVKSKCTGYRLIKGNAGSGKTYAVINKIPKIVKSYCIEEDDSLLFVAYNNEHLLNTKYIYDNLEKAKYEQRSFFDNENKQKVIFKDIKQMILLMFEQYKMKNNCRLKIASENKCLEYLKESIEVVKEKTKNRNRYEKKNLFNIDVIKKEIKFIKKSNYSSIEEYQKMFTSDAINIRRNSKDREIVFEILKEYNNRLECSNLIDKEDIGLLAFKYAKQYGIKKYTNIIIDGVQKFNKVELDILKQLYTEKKHSNMIFTLDNDKIENSDCWISRKRKFKTLGYKMTGKCTNFKNSFIEEVKKDNITLLNKNIYEEESKVFETCKYIDLNRKVCHEFFKDSDNSSDIYSSDDNFTERVKDIVKIPVYNEIAAGSPIPMNDEFEFNYTLPKEWVRADKNVFVLKIKGDSMVNKNINNGDYVVINKQKYPSNSDVVAVEIEGEATLKTFKKKGNTVTLFPENSAYEPIVLDKDKECSLLGVAIGIIKDM